MEKGHKQDIIKRLYEYSLMFLPWALLLGLFQQSYWRFFPLKRLFSGPQFWDWVTVIDLYVLLVVILLVLGLAFKAIRLEKNRFSGAYIVGIFLVLAAGILQIFFQKTYEPVLSTPAEYFRSLFVFPILVTVIIYLTSTKELVGKILKQYFYAVGAFCFLALIQYFSGIFPGDQYDFMQRLTWPYLDFMTLKASSANWVAFFVTPAVVILFCKVFEKLKAEKKLWLAWGKSDELKAEVLVLVLSAAVLYLTQSYGAYAAVFAAIGLYLFRAIKLKHFLAALLLMVILGGGIYAIQKSSYKYQVLSGQKDYRYENSAESRKDIYMMNLQMIKDHPWLGVGLNQYQSYFALTNQNVLGHKFNESHIPPHAHNFFLSMWLSLGIVGLAGMLLLVAGALVISKFRPENPAVFALVAMMTHGLIDSYYWKQEIAYIFWLIIFLVYWGSPKKPVT